MNQPQPDRLYEALRPMLNKLDDSDPCEVVSVDWSVEPATVRLKCDEGVTLDLTVSVEDDSDE